MILIARYYLKETGFNLLDEIEGKTDGNTKMLLREIFYNNLMPQELFAEKIYLSIKGMGTDEEKLSRVLVSRSDLDMDEIKNIYKNKYNTDLKEDIINDTSGIYQKLCLYLIGK